MRLVPASHSRGAMKKTWFLTCALWFLSTCASAVEPSEVDHRTWSVDKAEAAQREGWQRPLSAMRAKSSASSWQDQQAAITALTGIGGIPHAPRDEPTTAQRDAQSRFYFGLQQTAEIRAREKGISVQAAFDEIMPKSSDIAQLSMTLRTAAQGVVNTGGYIYAYTPQGTYRSASYIGANGTVTVSADPGELIDLVVLPQAPFAAQFVRGVTAAANGTVELLAGMRIPLSLVSAETPAYTGTSTVTLGLKLGPPNGFIFSLILTPDTTFGSVPSIYLAPTQSYEARLSVSPPWIAQFLPNVSSATNPLRFELSRGYTYELRFVDPAALNCAATGYISVTTSAALGAPQPIAQSIMRYDNTNQPIGFRVAVPRQQPVDLTTVFNGSCAAAGKFVPRVAFTGDVTEAFALQRRPTPQIALRTPGGEVVAYQYGFVSPTDDPDQLSYFTAGQIGSVNLESGRSYDLTLNSSESISPAAARFVARPGDFPVELTVERLYPVITSLQVPSGMSMRALLEVRRGAQLWAGFETYSPKEHELLLPVGQYEVTVTGLAGLYNSSAPYEYSSVLLRPFTTALTVTNAAGQRLGIPLALPASGFRSTFSAIGGDLHATVLQDGRAVAATTIPTYFTGVRSDYSTLRLKLRGPRFDDSIHDLTLTAAFPTIDIPALAGANTRYSGILRDSAGNPLALAPILVHHEAGHTSYSSTNAAGAFDLPLVRNSVVTFSPPDGGNDLMGARRFGAPVPTLAADVRLTAAQFLDVPATGSPRKLIYGNGTRAYKIAILAEGYTAANESFTDSNANGVWDGVLFLDFNNDRLWQNTEPVKTYGNKPYPTNAMIETDITAGNEPFVDSNGDGYPNINDYEVFVRNSKNYLRSLLATPVVNEGFDFDAYIIFLPSVQAGLDVYAADGQQLLARDTRFGARLDRSRSLLAADYASVSAAISEYVPDWDLRVVMMNAPVPAGRVNSFQLALGGIGASSPSATVVGHEFGHNPGGLADEYDEFGGTSREAVRLAVGHLTHVTDDLRSPWSGDLTGRLDAPLAIPNSAGIGLYSGASYQAGGVYRPSNNSRMRGNTWNYNPPSERRMRKNLCRVQLTAAELMSNPQATAAGYQQLLDPCTGFRSLDEPAVGNLPLPAPTDPPFPNCPGGYFIAAIDDGPGVGIKAGAYGLNLVLDPPGTQQLEGGLNFGGLLDGSQVAFAGFNVQNQANEAQRLDLVVSGNPSSSQGAILPVQIVLIRQPSAGVNETVYSTTANLSMQQTFTHSLTIQPGFHVLTVAPAGAASVPGGAADGEVYVSATSQFVNRPGGGFFGGVVVGGYHAAPLFGGTSGFASFCLGTQHTATANVVSAPSYGPAGARDLRLRLLDHVRRVVLSVP